MPIESRAIANSWAHKLLARCRCAVEPRVLRTNLLIALGVGILLSAANQYDVIRRTPVNARLLARMMANFVVPFAVSTLSAILNRRHPGAASRFAHRLPPVPSSRL